MDHTQFAEALFDSCPDGVILVADDGDILLANPISGSMFGRSVEDLVGSSVDDLVPMEFRHAHPQRRSEYGRHPTIRPMGTGLQPVRPDAGGEMFPVEISLSPIEIDDEHHTIATIRDISDRQGVRDGDGDAAGS